MSRLWFWLGAALLAVTQLCRAQQPQSEAHEKSLFAVVDPVYDAASQKPAPDVSTSAAPWLYGHAELECWRLRILRERAQAAALKVGYPGTFHTPSAQCHFRLELPAGAALPSSLDLRAVGDMVVTLAGQEIHRAGASDAPHQIVLPTVSPNGGSTLQVALTTQGEPPALLIQEGPFATGLADWQWSVDGILFSEPRPFPQTLSGLPPHRVELAEVILDPVSTNGALYDMGREVFGRVTFASASGTPALFVGESEAEANNSNSSHFEQSPALTNNGDGTWTSTHPLAFRYFRITGVTPANVKCVAQFSPAQYRGAFACSDQQLTRIWMTGAYTLRLCHQDFLIDGVKRDRLPWVGDLAMSLMANAYSFGDPEIVRRSLVALGRAGISQTHLNGIVDYSMWWIVAQDYYQKYYRDGDHLSREWLRIQDTLQRLAARCDADGLYVTQSGDWVFIDWASGDKQTALQIIWWWAQVSGAALAERMGDTTAAAYWRGRADALGQILHQRAWNPSAGGWRGVPNGTSGLSRHANIFAVVSGLAGTSQYPAIRSVLLGSSVAAVGTPYVAGFENMALARMGATTDFMARVNSVWGGMLGRGATTFWEAWDASQTGNNAYAFYGRPYAKSLCHAWSSGPTAFLPAEIFGLRPVDDGWSRFAVEPRLGSLTWACATVPTPHGDIEVSANLRRVSLTIPAGATALWQGRSFPGPDVVSLDRSAIGIDFRGGGPNGTPAAMSQTEIAGAIACSGWNSAEGVTGSLGSVIDNSNTSTPVSIAWSSNNLWSTSITDSPGNARMMKGYLDTSNTSITTVTVTNLPSVYTSFGYKVIVYVDGDNGSSSKAGRYTLGGTTLTVTDNASTNFSGGLLEASNSAGNYVVFPNQTSASFSLTATGTSTDSGPRAPVNAIQILANVPPLTPVQQWRLNHFSSIEDNGNSADSADPDGDGWSNANEFASGTDPNNPGSYLKISSLETGGLNVVISFPSVSGISYRVERSATLLGDSWVTVAEPVSGTGGEVVVTDFGARSQPRWFYRVAVLP